jgi:hypothetical protein
MFRWVLGALVALGLAGPASAAVVLPDLGSSIGSTTGKVLVIGSGVYNEDFVINVPTDTAGPVKVTWSNFIGDPTTLVVESAVGPSGFVFDAGATSATIFLQNMAGILPSGSYTVNVGAGLAAGFAGMKIEAIVTPIPAAVLLFGTALAGLGLLRARRRSAGVA